MNRCETCGKPCEHQFCDNICVKLHNTRSMPSALGERAAKRHTIRFDAEDVANLEMAGLCLVDGPCTIPGEPERVRYTLEPALWTTEWRQTRLKSDGKGEYLNPKYYKPHEGLYSHTRLRGGEMQ